MVAGHGSDEWKLSEIEELEPRDLCDEDGENHNLAKDHPEIVRRLGGLSRLLRVNTKE